MKTAFIIHGTGGHSKENWFPWLKSSLELEGYKVIVPDFGMNSTPNISYWEEIFSKYEKEINKNTLLIGHSLGGAFLLKFLQKYGKRVHLLATVGSPVGVKPIRFYEGDYAFLNGFNFDWKNISDKSLHQIIFHSDNDPYVSLGNGKELAKQLKSKLTLKIGCGHFNEASGFTEFPDLLQEIKKVI